MKQIEVCFSINTNPDTKSQSLFSDSFMMQKHKQIWMFCCVLTLR